MGFERVAEELEIGLVESSVIEDFDREMNRERSRLGLDVFGKRDYTGGLYQR